MTFYLKYRPQNLDELDIASVRESLKKIVDSKNIPHALLFAGPKGTGKTSTARILAKIINCESKNAPCGKCDQCVSIASGNNLDVIELDAASNRGIDDVRSLKESIKLAPTKANKKIYIIDEAHMMTTEAFNALLKTLEEPPSHVVFILATTNPEKIIDTIHSRCVSVNFTKAKDEEILRSLKRVIDGEKIKIKDELVAQIAKRAKGSFRDGVKLLESYVQEGEGFLEKGGLVDVNDFAELLYKRKRKELLDSVETMTKNNISVENFVEDLVVEVRDELIKNPQESELVDLLELLVNTNRLFADSPIEELPLQILIFKWCGDGVNVEVEELNEKEEEQEVSEQKDEKNGISNGKSKKKLETVDDAVWRDVLIKVKPINASIEALLRSSRPLSFDGKSITLGVFYKFHKERLEDGRNRKILEDVVTGIFGTPVKIVCTLTEAPKKASFCF